MNTRRSAAVNSSIPPRSTTITSTPANTRFQGNQNQHADPLQSTLEPKQEDTETRYGGLSTTTISTSANTRFQGNQNQHAESLQSTLEPKQEDITMAVDDDDTTTQGQKRKSSGLPFTKKPKQPKLDPKNAVLLLNELKPGLEYIYDDSETVPTAPSFKCTVTVNGYDYEGQGSSKKEARQKAAEDALRQQIMARNNDIFEKLAKRVAGTLGEHEVPDNVGNEQLFKLIEMSDTPHQVAFNQPKPPVMLLNELSKRALTYDCICSDGSGTRNKYTMRVEVNNESFEGSARSMKAAKTEASRLALAKLYNIYVPEVEVGNTGMSLLKDPASLLSEIHRTPFSYEVVGESGENVPNFSGGPGVVSVRVVINGQKFEEEGKSKKEAMARVATTVLSRIYGITGEVPVSHISGLTLFRSPITMLQHYHGCATNYEVTEDDVNKTVTATVIISGITYTGTGDSKKAARGAAARSALSKVYSVNIPDDENPSAVLPVPKSLTNRIPLGTPGFSSIDTLQKTHITPASVKPPSQVLKETHNTVLTYDCVKEDGPPHMKVYTMAVYVNDVKYEGEGRSKKEAKNEAARNALESVYNIKTNTTNAQAATNGSAPVTSNRCADTYPVMALHQISKEKLEYECVGREGPIHDPLYTMQVEVQGQIFTGQARSKKDAKAVAARNALASVYNV